MADTAVRRPVDLPPADWLEAHWMPYTGNREFKANPFGEHSPDLQYLLNIMRAPKPGPPM